MLQERQIKEKNNNNLGMLWAIRTLVWSYTRLSFRRVENQQKLFTSTCPPLSPTCTDTFSRVYGDSMLRWIRSSSRRDFSFSVTCFHTSILKDRDNLQLLLEPRQHMEPIWAQSALIQGRALSESQANMMWLRLRQHGHAGLHTSVQSVVQWAPTRASKT